MKNSKKTKQKDAPFQLVIGRQSPPLLLPSSRRMLRVQTIVIDQTNLGRADTEREKRGKGSETKDQSGPPLSPSLSFPFISACRRLVGFGSRPPSPWPSVQTTQIFLPLSSDPKIQSAPRGNLKRKSFEKYLTCFSARCHFLPAFPPSDFTCAVESGFI